MCKYAVPKGYPNKPIKGEEIYVNNIKNPDGLFYGSVNLDEEKIVLAGSRAVAVVATEESIFKAESVAEKEISSVGGPLFHRKDIGKKALIQNRIDHMRDIR